MGHKSDTGAAAISEGLMKVLIGGGVIGLAILAPNALKLLEKPLKKRMDDMDAKSRARELKRGLHYAKRNGWITDAGEGYEHGIQITDKGRQRLQRIQLDNLAVQRPVRWDNRWRLVFYDIPEERKSGRKALISKLKSLGFYQLQRSVLIHPFPCRQEIEAVTAAYEVEKYVSYIETEYIDQQPILIKKFPLLKNQF